MKFVYKYWWVLVVVAVVVILWMRHLRRQSGNGANGNGSANGNGDANGSTDANTQRIYKMAYGME